MAYFRPEIEAMAGYQSGEQPQVDEFIKLNTNENPYPPSPAVATAVSGALQRGLTRYPDPHATAFRQRAAALFDVGPDWILCGNGSDDILTIATRALVGARESLRLPYPSYVLYKTLAQIQGAQSEEVPFTADWALNEDFCRPAEELRLVFLPNPNSPSGTMIPHARILQFAEHLNCPLLVDEAYADFADFHCLDLVKQNERILVSRSLSKSYGLAGLRFGFLIGQPHIIRQLMKVKDSYNCDALSIAGAAAAIEDQSWLVENVAKVVATRQRLAKALGSLGFSVVPSHANFLWCTHPSQPAKPLYEQLKAKRVLVRYMDYPDWGDGLRISIGTDEQIDVCLALLGKMV
jgi:histidinol-phosphate aminotransferase